MSRFSSHETERFGASTANAGPMTASVSDPRDDAATASRLSRLAAVLEEEATLYEQMAGVSLALREALVRSGVESLRKQVSDQEDLIARIDLLERERGELVAALTAALGGGPRLMTIGEIVAVAREPERDRLRGLRERVLAEVHRIQKISETNSYLIGNSLEVVEGELALFADRDDVAYDRAGENVSGDAKTRILDRRA